MTGVLTRRLPITLRHPLLPRVNVRNKNRRRQANKDRRDVDRRIIHRPINRLTRNINTRKHGSWWVYPFPRISVRQSPLKDHPGISVNMNNVTERNNRHRNQGRHLPLLDRSRTRLGPHLDRFKGSQTSFMNNSTSNSTRRRPTK